MTAGLAEQSRSAPVIGTRAWLVNFLASLLLASIAALTVLIAGAPGWAALGFWWVVYLSQPRVRTR